MERDVTGACHCRGSAPPLAPESRAPNGAPAAAAVPVDGERERLEQLGRLAGDIAHDFCNLLAVILGACETAMDEVPPETPAGAAFARIADAGRRADVLCRRLVDHVGRVDAVPEPLDLNALLDEMRPLLECVAARRARLELRLAPGLPAVRLDAVQLQQVLLNLVCNACEASDPAGGTIAIATAAVDGGVELSVSDSGRGMDPETLLRVFDRHFTARPDGHGLGLAVVKSIVTAHGGTIEAHSAPGNGSRFTLRFPADASADPSGPGGTGSPAPTE